MKRDVWTRLFMTYFNENLNLFHTEICFCLCKRLRDIAEKMFTLLNTLRQLASEYIQFANEKKIMKRKKG